ncbi:hypothetical protein V8G54_004686, partial [Vigna mungo]
MCISLAFEITEESRLDIGLAWDTGLVSLGVSTFMALECDDMQCIELAGRLCASMDKVSSVVKLLTVLGMLRPAPVVKALCAPMECDDVRCIELAGALCAPMDRVSSVVKLLIVPGMLRPGPVVKAFV